MFICSIVYMFICSIYVKLCYILLLTIVHFFTVDSRFTFDGLTVFYLFTIAQNKAFRDNIWHFPQKKCTHLGFLTVFLFTFAARPKQHIVVTTHRAPKVYLFFYCFILLYNLFYYIIYLYCLILFVYFNYFIYLLSSSFSSIVHLFLSSIVLSIIIYYCYYLYIIIVLFYSIIN